MKMIAVNHELLSIRSQCSILKVNRSNLYYRPQIGANDTTIANDIHEIWSAMPFYGYRRITAELHRRGFQVNHKRVRRIMTEMGIQAIYARPRTSIRNKDHRVYPYLLRDVSIERVNQAWGTDITYIKLPHGFMYLVALIDMYSRYLIGWSLSNTMDVSFCLHMLQESLSLAKPEIINSDQGSQFTCKSWISLVENNGIRVSMDGRGRWADNIIIERFWRSLKHEDLLIKEYETAKEVKSAISEYIDLYNNKRLHQSLGYRTPAEVYWNR